MSSLPPIITEKTTNPFSVTSAGKKKNLSKTVLSDDTSKNCGNIGSLTQTATPCNTAITRTERLLNLIGRDYIEEKNQSMKLQTLNDTAINNLKPTEKESITDLLSKKREMFLVQMSLDTKREEIRKLEEKAHLKEDALLRSEQMLEEDAVRFDAFLKENDKKAHDAIKKAEEETRKKQEKVSM